MNNEFDKALKYRPDLNQIHPELGSPRVPRKHWARRGKVLCFENVEPEGLILGDGHDLPPPFDDQTLVHNESINNAQPPKAFWLTNMVPFDQALFALVISRVPIKGTSVFIKASMGSHREKIKAHQEHRKR